MSETKSTQLSEKYMRIELMDFIDKSIPDGFSKYDCERYNDKVLESMKQKELEKYTNLMNMINEGICFYSSIDYHSTDVKGFYFKNDKRTVCPYINTENVWDVNVTKYMVVLV